MSCWQAAPALEAVVPILKKFRPEPLFQSETSEMVEAAWEEIEGGISRPGPLSSTIADWHSVSGGLVALGTAESTQLSKTMHESIALKSDPEKHLYGLSLYQQLRCLNIIRKSFYRETFYASFTDERFQTQKSKSLLFGNL
jgi:hypothetical protein